MKITLKTDDEIQIMKEGGTILRKVVDEIIPKIDVGMKTEDIDSEAERLIKSYGAEPSFKTVKGYSWSTCLPVNAQAVHTPPSKYELTDGDIITLDIGVLYKGFHTDFAYSKLVGTSKDEKKTKFLTVGQETLEKALKKVKPGVHLGEIAEFIEKEINKHGYFILKELTGHGIGRTLHEDPFVLNYLDRPVQKTYRMKPGFVMALEIIYSMGTEEIAYETGNSWSIITKDKSLSGWFEKTVAVTAENGFILT